MCIRDRPDLPVHVAQIAVRHLPRSIARQLIVDLSTHHGLQFALDPTHKKDLPDQIVDLTAGNPYFIHILCRSLLFRVDRERRSQILPRDLERTVSEMLGYPVLFEHLFHALRNQQRAIVDQIAQIIPVGQRQSLSATQEVISDNLGFHLDDVATQIALLEQIDVLEVTGEFPHQHVGIPIQLLHKWLRFHWKR